MAIIYLYESTATDFRYNGQPLPKAYEVVVEYTINDSYFVAFKHPLDDAAVYKQIEKDMIVTVHTPDGLQPMRIMDETKHMDSVEYEAWPLLYADMRTKLVKPLALRGQTGTSAINYFVQNLLIDTPFDFSSNISETHDYHTQNTEDNENNPHALFNALDVLKDIVNRWNGELQINGYDIRMVNRLGKNTDALLYEKKNISEFTDEESIQGVVTRLYGISEWEEESDVEGEEPIKHTINTMVESPLISAYSGIVFEKQYTNNDMRTEEQLKSWLNLKFTTENIDKPTRSITVGTNIIDGEEIHIGDTLVLKYIKHDVDMSIRMVGYKYDGYADRYISVDLGDVKDTYAGNMQNIIDDNRNNLSNQMKQQYASIVNSLGEKMIYSVNEPSGNFREGDVWFDQQGGMYFWDEESGMWIDHPYNKNKKLVEEQVDALQEEVTQASKSAEEADNLANEAIGKAGESSDLAQAAKDAADRAETNAAAAGNKAADALAQSGSAVTAAEEAIQSIATFEPLVAGAVTKADNALIKSADAVTKADDAAAKANNAISSIESFEPLVTDAVTKSTDAITKANNIPATIDNTIITKGLVSGDWVNTQIDDVTGEFNYALTSVKGDVPDIIIGVTWDKASSPLLYRTNYVEEFANLRDYELKTADFNVSIDGLTSHLQAIERDKLDNSDFTSFKSNEYAQTVNGITNRLSSVETNKLESSTFTNFKEHDYDVTVNGINGSIESLEAEKLDSVEFSDFKTNEYELTVNGFKMDLMSISGAIPTLVLGVEWSRSEDPAMTRTDYAEDADLTDYHNPDYIMGATWDKSSDPTLARSDGVQELVELQEYKTQTADFKLTLDGFEQNLTDFESGKLDASLFTTFKTNEYTNTIDGITNRLTKTETNKLDGSDFLSFKTNDYQVTVDGLFGSIESLESEKLDNNTFTTFKTNDYDVTVSGISQSLTSLETNKLDSVTFTTFKSGEYANTVEGITGRLESVETGKVDDTEFYNFKENDYQLTVDGLAGRLTTVETDKLEHADFTTFKENDYQLTVDGLNMGLTSVEGAIAPVVLGAEWSRDPSPALVRTDSVQDNVRLEDYRQQTADFEFTLNGFSQTLANIETKKLDGATFETFKTGDYKNTIDGIAGRLTSVETDKLTKSEFQSFKTNDYSVTVDGLAGRLTSVESNKLDSGTFQTFKTSDYSVTVDGLDGKIQSLETKKLDSADFALFKTNDYQLTVNGFDMALTSVSGAIPTIILGVSWSRASNPTMERTNDAAATDLSNYDSPDYIMGVEWLRDSKPEMDRIRDTQESTSTKDFEIFLGDYNFNAQGWNATNTYINDNKTSINSLISNAQGWSNTISYVDENKTAINETISQVTHYKQTIVGENGEKIAQLVMTDDAFVTRVSDLENMTADIVLGVEWERVSSPRLVRTGFMEDWASSQISQLADNINLKVSEGDVISQINIEAKRTLIQSDKLYLDANSVVFSNKAFIPSAAIVELTADKITSGKLDASKVRVVNLDANEITANQTQFITTHWNSAVGGGVSIDGNGILSTAANKSQTYIQNGIVGTRNPNGATIGQIGYINTGTIATYSLRTSWGSHFELRQRSNATTEYTMLRAENGATNFFINAREGIYLNTSNTGGRVNINSEVRILGGNRLFLEDARIVNPYGIYLNHGGEFYTLSGGSATRIGFGSELQFRQGATSTSTGNQKMMIDSTRNYMYQTLNMNGNSITESPSVSDARLKDIQRHRSDNDLEKLMNIEYVDFVWKEDGKPDFGFIAQQIQGFAPEIVRDVNGGWLGYDQASYTHLIGHALQQHAGITANQLTQLRQENEALHDRITGLEVRITELERAM